jgi:hypothetical protein
LGPAGELSSMPAAGVRVEFVRFGKRTFGSLEITVTSKKEQNKKKE